MLPDNAPPSFSSAGMTGSGPQQHQWPASSQIQATGDVYNQPPSYDSMDHGEHDSQNRFHDQTTYRGFGQPAGIVDGTKAPSFTGIGHDQGNSYNSGGSFSRDGSSGGQPPSMNAMAKGSVSLTSGDVNPYSGDKPPNLSDVNRRPASQIDDPESLIVITDPDAEEYVGMSLVGKNFRKFYPNAYYREKEDEN